MVFLSFFAPCFLYAFIQVVSSQDPYYTFDASSAPATSNFIRRGWGQAVVVGDYLYYDGGDIAQMVDGNYYSAPNNSTLSIDLSTAWNNQTVKFDTVNKTAQQAEPWNNAYLWPDPSKTTFYQWGGEWSFLRLGFGTQRNELAQFRPDGHGAGQWGLRGPTANSVFPSLSRGVAMAMTYDRVDTAYFLGGYRSCHTDPSISDCGADARPLGPMVAYNASTNTWTNSSATGLTPWPNALQWGRMENAPFNGPKGLNIIFAGYTAGTVSDRNSFLGLDTVYIHDPVTGDFWNQTTISATGSMPEPRIKCCSVGMLGSNGTFEIFIFGGTDLSKTVDDDLLMSDAVWVLSLPSFVWFRADYPPQLARSDHMCNVASQASSQMIVIGGRNRTEVTGPNATDPWANGINVFDLNNMAWKSDYNPNASAYKTPTMITAYLQNSGPLPRSWNYPEVQRLFAATFTPSSPSPSPNSSASPTASSLPKQSHTGAIVGGVVGGIAGLICITLIIGWFVLRNRRKQQRRDRGKGAYEKPELPPSEAKEEYKFHQPEQQLPHEVEANPRYEMFTDTDTREADASREVGRQQTDGER